MFDIEFDAGRNRVMIRVRGFWGPAQVADLAAGIAAKEREIGYLGGRFDAVVESFDFPVQSNEVADMLAVTGLQALERTSGRAAVVVGSWLNKLQAERTLAHPRLRVFTTMEEAENWLIQPRTDAA